MKKIIFGILLVIIFAVAGGVYYVMNNLDALVKQAIETHGSAATKTAVLVDQVKIDLTQGSAGISGLTIDNPSGFTLPYAFSLGEIRAGIDLQSLQQEPYIINEITVLAPQVFVEFNVDNKTNLNELKNNLLPASSTPVADKKPANETAGSAGPRLIIRKIKFADGNIQARVAALQNKEYQLKLPSLEMNDLGGSEGITAGELSREIISRLTDRASAVVKDKVIDQELEKVKALAREKIEQGKAKLKAQADAEKIRLQAIADQKKAEQEQKAKDKLKNLFNR